MVERAKTACAKEILVDLRDVFKDDIIKDINKDQIYIVEEMNSNNGNFRAKDLQGRLCWFSLMKEGVTWQRII